MIDSILSGLSIDQTDFKDRLEKTAYRRGVSIYLDGVFETIYRTPT